MNDAVTEVTKNNPRVARSAPPLRKVVTREEYLIKRAKVLTEKLPPDQVQKILARYRLGPQVTSIKRSEKHFDFRTPPVYGSLPLKMGAGKDREIEADAMELTNIMEELHIRGYEDMRKPSLAAKERAIRFFARKRGGEETFRKLANPNLTDEQLITLMHYKIQGGIRDIGESVVAQTRGNQ